MRGHRLVELAGAAPLTPTPLPVGEGLSPRGLSATDCRGGSCPSPCGRRWREAPDEGPPARGVGGCCGPSPQPLSRWERGSHREDCRQRIAAAAAVLLPAGEGGAKRRMRGHRLVELAGAAPLTPTPLPVGEGLSSRGLSATDCRGGSCPSPCGRRWHEAPDEGPLARGVGGCCGPSPQPLSRWERGFRSPFAGERWPERRYSPLTNCPLFTDHLLSSALCLLPSVFCPLSSVLCPLSSALCPLPLTSRTPHTASKSGPALRARTARARWAWRRRSAGAGHRGGRRSACRPARAAVARIGR